jgi:hypothetical protein
MALGLMAAGTASAQGIYYYGPGFYGRYYPTPRYAPGLPPGQIDRIVRSAGYAPLSAPVRRGPNYVVPAVGRQGQVRVIVDAYAGDIVGVRPMVAAAPYGEPPVPHDPRLGNVPPQNVPPQNVPPGYREPPVAHGPGADPRAAEGNGPVPPRNVPGAPVSPPNQRIANAPAGGAAAVAPPPARTPIPRPRPNVAEAPAATATAPAPARTTPPAAATPAEVVPEAPPAPARPATPLVPVAPLD